MQHIVAVVLITLLVIFKIYWRTRKQYGFQKFARGRMLTKMALLAIIGVVLLVTGLSHPLRYIFDTGGLLLGWIIACHSLRTSVFEWRNQVWFYRQNPWMDMFLLVLFAGRVAFKGYNEIYALATNEQIPRQLQLTTYTHDSFVTGIIFTLIAYHIVYYSFLIRKECQMKSHFEDK
ncbi:MAG: hypothetical protein P4N59_24410 [Negativicutes bacterium]|nr:hypothetical protein [Negativicutes bacterium]